MDVMRKAIYMLSVLCVAALWGGCQRGGGGTDATAEVTLRFSTRADGDGTGTATDPNALSNEGIKTLRVILYKAGEDGSYSFYGSFYKTVDAAENGKVLETSMRIYDVPLGNYRFYVIANEESIGQKYDTKDAVEEDLVTVGREQKLLIKDDGSVPETNGESYFYFPQDADGIAEHGLPMARIVSHVEVAKGMEPVSVILERAVTKLNVIVQNATADEITVQQIKFGEFAADYAYLFRTTELDIPENAVYAEMLFGDPDKGGVLEKTIPAFGEDYFVFYVYPSSANIGETGSQTAYTIGLNTAKNEYPMQPFVNQNGSVLNMMTRNVQYNISVRISAEARITVNWKSTTWDNAQVDVPEFN